MTRSRALVLTRPVLAAGGGFCAAQAIRIALHHGHLWPLLAALAAAAWTGNFLAVWLPYRAERNALLRRKAFLLQLRDELPGMAAEATRRQEGES
jgi:hypothetical protein